MNILSERPHDPVDDAPVAYCDFCDKSRLDRVYEGGEITPFFEVTFDDSSGPYWVCQFCKTNGTMAEAMGLTDPPLPVLSAIDEHAITAPWRE